MNIQPMEAKTYTSAAEIIRDAQERRRRIFSPANRKRDPAEAPRPAVTVYYPRSKVEVDHNEHVREWLRWRGKQGSVMRTRLMELCEAKGWPVSLIKNEAKSRVRAVAEKRQEMAWVLRTEFNASWNQIARILCYGDHSTAIHAFETHEKRRNNPGWKPRPLKGEDKGAPHPKSGLNGVHWCSTTCRWKVRIFVDGKSYKCKTYKHLDTAKAVALKAHEEMNSDWWRKTHGKGT